MARRLTARTLPAWVGDLPVFERTVGHGLRALVLPRTHAPIVVCDLYYPVGSVDEPPGRSGLAHFLEHMLFKGTDRLPKGQIDRLSFLAAGQSNAETSEDFTHYWFAFPRDRWELALAIEADRMTGARFDAREVEAERHVIAEERARELDSPLGRLDQTHLAMSYLVHPYRNPILGWPEDLRQIDINDLVRFYEAHYRPEAAVLVVVGDLEPERALDRIEAHFAGVSAGAANVLRSPIPAEPPQNGRRDFTLVESEAVVRGLLGWHSVPRGHRDAPALGVLSDLLTCGRRARLWDRLVERDRLATWVEASQEGSRLAGQFLIQIEAAPGTEPERLEAAIRDEIERLGRGGPTPDELARSRSRLEAAWRWEQEDLGGLASGLGHVALWGDWRAWQEEHRAALAVTAEDVARVARAHLVETRLTAGWSLPRTDRPSKSRDARGTTTRVRPAPARALEQPLGLQVPVGASSLPDYRPRRAVLPSGLRLLTERRPGCGTVALELFCEAGALVEARPGAAFLTARMREEGTEQRTAETIAEAIEDVGGTLDVSSTGFSLRVRSEDLELAVDLLSDLLLRPTFPEDALAWAKRRTVAELQGDLDDPSYRGELLFRRLVYGEHPYGRDARGSPTQIRALRTADLRAHHESCFRPDGSVMAVVGDFEPRALRGLVERHLGSWSGQSQVDGAHPRPTWTGRRRTRRVYFPGEQVHILLGHLGLSRLDPDFDAMVIVDHILGSGPGFTDRLSRILRDEMGLAYAVQGGCTDSADLVPGTLRIYVGTGPDEAERAVAGALEQVAAMHAGDFSDEEVERAQNYLAGSWVFDFQTVGQRAERLLDLERWGQSLDEPVRWPERISRIRPDAVRAAARRHLHPEAMVRVEYGPIRRRRRAR